MTVVSRIGRCPKCGSPAQLDDSNGFRPFCSERCKMLDFGAWISGQYTIPAVEDDEGIDEDAPPPRLQ